MKTVETPTYEAILKTVRAWPPAERLTLVQDILKTLAQAPGGGSKASETRDAAFSSWAARHRPTGFFL